MNKPVCLAGMRRFIIRRSIFYLDMPENYGIVIFREISFYAFL